MGSTMGSAHYSVRIGEGHSIGVRMSYPALLACLVEFTLRAAIARSADESCWEHEELRRHGLAAVQVFRNARAVWDDPHTFNEEINEARRTRAALRFRASNELDPGFFERLDCDLRAQWRRMGYESPSMRTTMKALFGELERDVATRTEAAREDMLVDLLRALQEKL
jgi:hypothetical protein